jgi:pyrroline-5-carboxylate reductase
MITSIALIGCGHLGGALVQALLSSGQIKHSALLIIQPGSRSKSIARKFKCPVLERPDARISRCAVVVFAVRPQQCERALSSISPYLTKKQLFISCMAGVPLAKLARGLPKSAAIVRCMPNLGVKVQQSVTACYKNRAVSGAQTRNLLRIIKTMGAVLELNSDRAMDAATAVSGSGPGYHFFLWEEMVRAACKLGFTRAQAISLVGESSRAALTLWNEAPLEIAALAEGVATKGGGTEAAFKEFRRHKLPAALRGGMTKAFKHYRKLSKT